MWKDDESVWSITLHPTDNEKATFTVEAEILVSAIGGFSLPSTDPTSFPGLSEYKGDVSSFYSELMDTEPLRKWWHSARYNHSISLRNKKVAVIGNGCSGAQIIPESRLCKNRC